MQELKWKRFPVGIVANSHRYNRRRYAVTSLMFGAILFSLLFLPTANAETATAASDTIIVNDTAGLGGYQGPATVLQLKDDEPGFGHRSGTYVRSAEKGLMAVDNQVVFAAHGGGYWIKKGSGSIRIEEFGATGDGRFLFGPRHTRSVEVAIPEIKPGQSVTIRDIRITEQDAPDGSSIRTLAEVEIDPVESPTVYILGRCVLRDHLDLYVENTGTATLPARSLTLTAHYRNPTLNIRAGERVVTSDAASTFQPEDAGKFICIPFAFRDAGDLDPETSWAGRLQGTLGMVLAQIETVDSDRAITIADDPKQIPNLSKARPGFLRNRKGAEDFDKFPAFVFRDNSDVLQQAIYYAVHHGGMKIVLQDQGIYGYNLMLAKKHGKDGPNSITIPTNLYDGIIDFEFEGYGRLINVTQNQARPVEEAFNGITSGLSDGGSAAAVARWARSGFFTQTGTGKGGFRAANFSIERAPWMNGIGFVNFFSPASGLGGRRLFIENVSSRPAPAGWFFVATSGNEVPAPGNEKNYYELKNVDMIGSAYTISIRTNQANSRVHILGERNRLELMSASRGNFSQYTTIEGMVSNPAAEPYEPEYAEVADLDALLAYDGPETEVQVKATGKKYRYCDLSTPTIRFPLAYLYGGTYFWRAYTHNNRTIFPAHGKKPQGTLGGDPGKGGIAGGNRQWQEIDSWTTKEFADLYNGTPDLRYTAPESDFNLTETAYPDAKPVSYRDSHGLIAERLKRYRGPKRYLAYYGMLYRHTTDNLQEIYDRETGLQDAFISTYPGQSVAGWEPERMRTVFPALNWNGAESGTGNGWWELINMIPARGFIRINDSDFTIWRYGETDGWRVKGGFKVGELRLNPLKESNFLGGESESLILLGSLAPRIAVVITEPASTFERAPFQIGAAGFAALDPNKADRVPAESSVMYGNGPVDWLVENMITGAGWFGQRSTNQIPGIPDYIIFKNCRINNMAFFGFNAPPDGVQLINCNTSFVAAHIVRTVFKGGIARGAGRADVSVEDAEIDGVMAVRNRLDMARNVRGGKIKLPAAGEGNHAYIDNKKINPNTGEPDDRFDGKTNLIESFAGETFDFSRNQLEKRPAP